MLRNLRAGPPLLARVAEFVNFCLVQSTSQASKGKTVSAIQRNGMENIKGVLRLYLVASSGERDPPRQGTSLAAASPPVSPAQPWEPQSVK